MPERTCTGAQAINVADLTGTSLPMKSIALTFDDGPGVRASELSTYLKSEGIRAGFFVNGRMLGGNVQVLAQIIADGHVIGNHTQTHTSLTGRATHGPHLDDATTVSEIAQTDALIAPFVANSRYMFRAPFGDYDALSATAINASLMRKYVGPINWDIGDRMGPDRAADWDCWQPGSDGLVITVAQCSALYVKEFESVGRGVALLHDPYFIDNDPAKGGTVDMVKLMVPVLKAKGFTFVRIDEVPDIAALLPALPAPDGGASDASADATSHAMSDAASDAASDASGAPSGSAGPNALTALPSSGSSASNGKPDPCAPSRLQVPKNNRRARP